MKSFFLTVFLLVCFSGSAQVDDFQKEIIDLLNINGTRVDCGVAFYEVFPVLQRNFKDKDIPEEAWAQLQEDEEQQVDEALRQLSFAYRKHFTREDIAGMTDFYMSDAAQKYLSDEELTEEENQQIDEFLASELGKKMKDNKKDLLVDTQKIKALWSRELFGAKIKQLVKGGFL